MTNREYMMTLDNKQLVNFIHSEYNHEEIVFNESKGWGNVSREEEIAHMVEWLGLDKVEYNE